MPRSAALRCLTIALAMASPAAGDPVPGGARQHASRRLHTVVEFDVEAGEEPHFVCLLYERAPRPSDYPVLVADWEARLARYLRELRQHDGADPQEPGLFEDAQRHPAQPGDVVARAFRALWSLPSDVALAHNWLPTLKSATRANSIRTVPNCYENQQSRGDPARHRVLLIGVQNGRLGFGFNRVALNGNLLHLISTPGATDVPTLLQYAGHYITGRFLALRDGPISFPLRPHCVIRPLTLPPSVDLDRGEWEVTLGPSRAATERRDGPEDSSRLLDTNPRVALPVTRTSTPRERTLVVRYRRGTQASAVLVARWATSSPPAQIHFTVRDLPFLWSNQAEYRLGPTPGGDVFAPASPLRCPTATLDALNHACERATLELERDGAPRCAYQCRLGDVGDGGIALPVRIRFESGETGDRWHDDVVVLGQHLHAPPDPATRHIVADVSAWPEELRTTDEIQEVTVLSEDDHIYHLFPRPDNRSNPTWLFTVPGARNDTPLRLVPFGAHAFSAEQPVPVRGGIVSVPNPASLITRYRFGLRVGAELNGFNQIPGLGWSFGFGAQASVRRILSRLRPGGRFTMVEASFHYLLAELPYFPVQSAPYQSSTASDAVWYNRAGIGVAMLFPTWTWRLHVGPTMRLLWGWPLYERQPGPGNFCCFVSLGATIRYNISAHWSIEFDLGAMLAPAPRFEADDFRGDPVLAPNWDVAGDLRLGLRYWF